MTLIELGAVPACPLEFGFTHGLVRSKFFSSSLDGVEASNVTAALLRKLRTALVAAVWSKGMPLVNSGAVLSFLEGSQGCHPAFYVVRSSFKLMKRYSDISSFGCSSNLCTHF